MELRPFRSIRFSPETIRERGLPSLIAPPSSGLTEEARQRLEAAAPENIIRITSPAQPPGDSGKHAAETLKLWLAEGVLLKERRPGLWLYRQSFQEEGHSVVLPLLVGLVRLAAGAGEIELPEEPAPAETKEKQLALLRDTKADLQPSLLVTRAPLADALATTRRPDLSATDAAGVRHDALRISDYAQHVELQGLVKNAEASLAGGLDLYEAAREFSKDASAAKLSGAKYKLCAIIGEASLAAAKRPPAIYAGLFGVSLEDPVY